MLFLQGTIIVGRIMLLYSLEFNNSGRILIIVLLGLINKPEAGSREELLLQPQHAMLQLHVLNP